MKKLLAKLVRRKSGDKEAQSRITNDTVAEHRERILAGGRKFKYPLQYAKHKLVINTVIISIVAVIVLMFVGWWQLYSVQNTSKFFYKVTQVLPLPVASVNGQPVSYSDYLMRYRGAAYYLETKEQVNLNSDDGKIQVDFKKQQSMDRAVSGAYVKKLAKELNLTITDAEIESLLKTQQGEQSQQTYDASILDYYNWSPDEYRTVIKATLLRQKVSYAIDKDARALIDKISLGLVGSSFDLKVAIKSIKPIGSSKPVYGQPSWVPKANKDGGLAIEAAKLQKGKVSDVVKTTTADGYYLIRLLDMNATQVKYEYIKIPLTAFSNKLDSLKSNGEIDYYITLDKVTNS